VGPETPGRGNGAQDPREVPALSDGKKPTVGNRRFPLTAIARALDLSSGLLTFAAQRLRCDYKTVQRAVAKSPVLQAIVLKHREKLVDLAETGLAKHLKAGNLTACIYTSKTQGQTRGWIEKPSERALVPQVNIGPVVQVTGDSEQYIESLRAFRRWAAAHPETAAGVTVTVPTDPTDYVQRVTPTQGHPVREVKALPPAPEPVPLAEPEPVQEPEPAPAKAKRTAGKGTQAKPTQAKAKRGR
jgi:hypothetical protein